MLRFQDCFIALPCFCHFDFRIRSFGRFESRKCAIYIKITQSRALCALMRRKLNSIYSDLYAITFRGFHSLVHCAEYPRVANNKYLLDREMVNESESCYALMSYICEWDSSSILYARCCSVGWSITMSHRMKRVTNNSCMSDIRLLKIKNTKWNRSITVYRLLA